jgi:uncharacterized protein with PIN domain
MNEWKCPLCNKRTKEEKEKHIRAHIETSYLEEVAAFQATQKARQLYKKLFKEDI